MSNLVAASEVLDYFVESPNTRIGWVDHFYIAEQNWSIPSFKLSANQEWIKDHYTIPSSMVDWIDVSSRRIFLKEDLNKIAETLKEKPPIGYLHKEKDFFKLDLRTPEKSFGKVEDLLFDREKWTIENVVFRTHRLFGGKHLLLRPEHIQRIAWNEGQLIVSLHESEVLNSPEFKRKDSPFQSAQIFG